MSLSPTAFDPKSNCCLVVAVKKKRVKVEKSNISIIQTQISYSIMIIINISSRADFVRLSVSQFSSSFVFFFFFFPYSARGKRRAEYVCQVGIIPCIYICMYVSCMYHVCLMYAHVRSSFGSQGKISVLCGMPSGTKGVFTVDRLQLQSQ